MAPLPTPVLNGTSTSVLTVPQPEDTSPLPETHLLHKSQENNPVLVALAEAVVEPRIWPLPMLPW